VDCGETLTGLFSHTCSYASVPARFIRIAYGLKADRGELSLDPNKELL